MFRKLRFSTWLGLFFAAVACLVIFVWIPLDVETSYFETKRRRLIVGDSLAPTVAAVIVLLGALMTLFRPGPDDRLTRDNIVFMLCVLILLGASFGLMRWVGPLVTAALTDQEYRVLRDTAPWKFMGYLCGGTVLISGLVALVEQRLRWRSLVIGLLATLCLIALYDLPFDDLVLPPNGDI